MMSKRFPVITVFIAACLLGAPLQTSAMAIANSSLGFENLLITPTEGEISLDGPWSLETFAHADNSLGEIDGHFTSGNSPGTVSANVSAMTVTWASATGTASAPNGAPNDPPDFLVTGSAQSDVNLPGPGAAAAFGNSHGTLFNSFTLSDSGNVQFAIDISGLLNVMTDAFGVFARTETVFTLEVDGTPILFQKDILSIGPSDSATQAILTSLSNTVTLDAGSHFLLLEVDSESSGAVPEPPVGLLLITGLAALAAARRRPGLVRARGVMPGPQE